MLPHKKAKKAKSPQRPAAAGEGEGDGAAQEPPKSPKSPKSPKAPKSGKSSGRKKSKSPGGRKKSKSPAGRKKSKSPRGRKKSKSPGGRKKSKSRSRSRKRERPPDLAEPEPEPWRPRSDSLVPDYEAIRVTESLLPLRQDFFTVIDHLAADERLKNYTSEFVRLYERVAAAHDQKYELKAALEEQAARVEQDANAITRFEEQAAHETQEAAALRRQVEELRAEVDASRLRELDSKGMIDNLREEVDRYQEQMRHVVPPTEENEELVDYERLKKKIILEKQEMAETNAQLKKHLAEMYEQQEEAHRKSSEAHLQVTNLSEKLQHATQEVHREQRLKEKLEEELEGMSMERNEQAAKEAELAMTIRAADKTIATLQAAAKEQRSANDKLAKENDALSQRLQDQRKAYDRMHAELDKVRQDCHDKSFEIASQEATIGKLRSEVKMARHSLDNVFNRLGMQLLRGRQVEEQRQELALSVKTLGRELDAAQREVDQEKRELADLTQAKQLLVNKVVRGEETYKTAASCLLVSEKQRRCMEAEVAQHAAEAVKQRRLIAKLEQERELLHADKANLNKQVDILTDQLNTAQLDALHYQRQLAALEAKLQAQVNLTEATVLQRNKFEKLYEEARTVRDDVKCQVQLMSASEQQLKETLAQHEMEARRLAMALSKAERDKACAAREVNALQLQQRQLHDVIEDLRKAEAALKRGAAGLERERARLERDLLRVHNERDVIGTQLVRRNDEIHLLHTKIGVLQNMIASGEEEYLQRVDDVRLLKLEIRKQRQEKVLLQRDLVAGADLRRELYHLSKDLAFEKQRRVALESELKTPMNLHRWRRLEASDPASLELIHKVNLLQKRLLAQHSLLLAKERQLQDAEKLYLALRATMVKLPGPDVLLRLKKAQHALEHRARKIKSLFAELSMTEATVHDYRVDLNRTREELADFKSMYFTAKKKLDALGQPLPLDKRDKDNGGLPPIATAPAPPGPAGRAVRLV